MLTIIFCRFLVVRIGTAISLEMETVGVYRHEAKVIRAERDYQISLIRVERNGESMTQKNKYIPHSAKAFFRKKFSNVLILFFVDRECVASGSVMWRRQ